MALPRGQLEIRILGPLDVVSGGALLRLGGQKQRAVLAILTIRAGTVISADELIESLWSGRPPATASTTVQVYVSRLRKLLGADLIATTGGGYVLRVEPDQLDAARFEQLAARGRELRSADKPTEASAALTQALSLWRGPPLADFSYDGWAQGPIGRLEELRLSALEDRIEADLACGRHGELVGELESLIAEHPLRERLRGQLMLALYRGGRQAEALESYQRARSRLVDELGIEPSPELQELNRKILQQDLSLARAAGERRLPTGTVTLLATDIEGSTRLLSELGVDGYGRALEEHRGALRNAVVAHDGVEVDHQGDAFLVVFARPQDAVAAAVDAQRAHANGPVRLRVGIHTGTPRLAEEGYVGLDVHRAARVMAAGHGGQVLVSQTTCDLLDGEIGMRDLGVHRLKDLTAPQRLYQLLIEGLPDGFPALKTLEARPTNLPVQPSPLIGRERELAEVCSLLRRDDVRLLTLTGPGGSGKTRLGLQVAAELLGEQNSGTFFVGLAPVTQPELVVPTIAQTLGLHEWPGRTISETLRDYLERKTLFLLLDNLEQVVDAAPAIGDLLASCPKLSILTTSREPLRLAAEREYPVDPLGSRDALALFAERARTAKPDFALTPDKEAVVREICRRLDDLPLAIELAASRVKLLPLEALRARLDKRLSLLTRGARDAPARQRTLRATIEWSFKLLAEDEQALFARLGVFPGSFSLEAAEEITGGDLEGIGSLLDKSLLRQAEGPASEPRFFLLETIREYAHERLRESGELDDLRRRHAEHFVSWAEKAESRGRGPEQRLWMARMRAERSNLRAVLARALETEDLESSLWLVGLLWGWWEALGWGEETLAWLDQALPRATRPTLARCAALIEAGRLDDEMFGEYERALTRYEEARRIAERAGESKWESLALAALGYRLAHSGRVSEGRSRCEEALTLARELQDELTIAGALNNLAAVLLAEGNLAGARSLFEECLATRRSAGSPGSIANVLGNLGWMAIHQGMYTEAAEFLEEGLSIAHELGDSWHTVVMHINLGWVELLRGSPTDAEALFVKALAGLEEGILEPRGSAECFLGLAGSALELGDLVRAARLAAAGEVLVEQLGSTLAEPEANVRERVRSAVEQAAWDKGRKLTFDQALSLALSTGNRLDAHTREELDS